MVRRLDEKFVEERLMVLRRLRIRAKPLDRSQTSALLAALRFVALLGLLMLVVLIGVGAVALLLIAPGTH